MGDPYLDAWDTSHLIQRGNFQVVIYIGFPYNQCRQRYQICLSKKKKILNMFYEILIMAHETLKKINGTWLMLS